MTYRRLLAFLVALALPVAAQTLPGERHPVSRNVNRWITFPLGAGETDYPIFFFNLDEENGFSVHGSGFFRIAADGRCTQIPFTPNKNDPDTLRIASNQRLIILSDQCRTELGL